MALQRVLLPPTCPSSPAPCRGPRHVHLQSVSLLALVPQPLLALTCEYAASAAALSAMAACTLLMVRVNSLRGAW